MKPLEITYQLAELPSAQHRAGLAGLVLMLQYLKRQPGFEEQEKQGAIAQIHEADFNGFGVTLRFNLEGLQALLNLTYCAFEEERSTETKIKKFNRIEEKEVTDAKGKTKLVKRYFYTVNIPQGAFLVDWDKSSDDSNRGLWVKLWRDMLWTIIRGVPTTRNPYNQRVNGGNYTQDAQQIWGELQYPEKAIAQTGQYYLGAMATNSENVPTKDKAKYQFLLHFWVFVAQVYCPMVLDKDGRRERCGYALAIPDVADLRKFCVMFPDVLKNREIQPYGYLPREAIIDLPEEGALDLLLLLRDRIAKETGDQSIRRLILGIELIHAEKVGNSVKIRSISTITPVSKQIDRYAQIKQTYWCPWFRKQRLLNLLNSQPTADDETESGFLELPAWYEFDAVLSRIPRKWLKDHLFSHDARELFQQEGDVTVKKEVREYAQIVYQVCQHYVLSKLESKHKLVWKDCDGNPKKEEEYAEKKDKIANNAFLAVRSRTESQAFIDYFASTLYPFIRKDEFAEFAEILFTKTDEIRALTLLALSSQFSQGKKSDPNKNSTDAA